MERKRKVITSQGAQLVVDDDVIKAMEERPSVSMGCHIGQTVCSTCGVFDTKCTHMPSNKTGQVSGDMSDFYTTAIESDYSNAQETAIVEEKLK